MAAEAVRKHQFDPSKIFQPDALAPAQFYATTQRTNRAEPELRLMAAVLEDAVATLNTDQSRCSKRQRREFKEAMEWINSKSNEDWVFSFVNICETFAIDPDYLRSGLSQKVGQIEKVKSTLAGPRERHLSPRRKIVRLRAG